MRTDHELKLKLLSQALAGSVDHSARLDECCRLAEAFARAQGGIAVVSDFLNDRSYTFSGPFGRSLGLEPMEVSDSAFEEMIFSSVDPQDLIDRHVLELRYMEFIKSLRPDERTAYVQSSKINLKTERGQVPIIHQTRYMEITDSGSIHIGLCTYFPVGLTLPDTFEGQILNLKTGLPLTSGQLQTIDDRLLSFREKEVLALLSKGLSSKQIASQLHISSNTVYRHRQNILRHLNVANTAEAVRIGLKMKWI